jgi:hypothetical protein
VSSIELRPYRPGDDAGILALKCAVFPGLILENERVRWEWEFGRNPAPPPPFPRALVLDRAGAIVGAFVFLPYRVQVGDEVVVGASGIDLCIAPDARGGGRVHEMVRRWLDPGFCAFPFAVALNDASRHLFTKHGAQLLGGLGESIAWGRFLASPFEPPARASLDVETITDLPADTDALWERVRRDHRLLLVKDAAYLRWRWRDYPFGGVTLLRAVGVRGETRGFAMLQDDPKSQDVYVADLLHAAGDDEAQHALLRRAVAVARAAERRMLWASTRDARQLPALREEGFALVPAPVPTFCARVHVAPRGGAVAVSEWSTAIGDGDQLFNCNEPRDGSASDGR